MARALEGIRASQSVFLSHRDVKQHTRSTELEARTMKKDSPASSHGCNSLAAGPELRDECVWAAFAGQLITDMT